MKLLTLAYCAVTLICGIRAAINAAFLVGAPAIIACCLCYLGTAGVVGSLVSRRDMRRTPLELAGIAGIAAVLVGGGFALMIWSGFWIGILGHHFEGWEWATLGCAIAVLVTRKEDVG